MATAAEEKPSRGRTAQEVLVTVLLVVAALGTSWSSYQATRWNGEQAKAASRTNAIRIDAARAQGLSQAQSQVDVATFIAWADADRRGEAAVAAFYAERFRAAAETSAAEVRRDIQIASDYVLTVVLYAVVLFFAGMSTKIANLRLRWILAGAGCLVLAGAIAWIATFPISFQV